LAEVAKTAAGLDRSMKIEQDSPISNFRADFWILYSSQGLPLAAVEVKKPGCTDEDYPYLYGQLYDYM
jgi:hypothetical protein